MSTKAGDKSQKSQLKPKEKGGSGANSKRKMGDYGHTSTPTKEKKRDGSENGKVP